MALRTDPYPPPIGGRRCLFEWNLNELAQFFFEVPTSLVMPLLPRGIYPQEPRPGVALIDVGFVDWAAGNWEPDWPAFTEVSVLLAVQPDLSYPMPMPKYAFFALNICADFIEFLKTEPTNLKLPTFYSPLTPKFDAERYRVEVTSPSGPLMQLTNTQHPVHYEPVDWVGQFFTVEDGILYMGIWQWIGLAAEHQAPGRAGKLFKHPVFRGLDLEPYDTTYLQLFAKPGTGSIQRFYETFPLGPAVYEHRIG